jgi:hypothetical protein
MKMIEEMPEMISYGDATYINDMLPKVITKEKRERAKYYEKGFYDRKDTKDPRTDWLRRMCYPEFDDWWAILLDMDANIDYYIHIMELNRKILDRYINEKFRKSEMQKINMLF